MPAKSDFAMAAGCGGGGVKCLGKALAFSSIALNGAPPARDPWAILSAPWPDRSWAAGAGAVPCDITSGLANASTATNNTSLQLRKKSLVLREVPDEQRIHDNFPGDRRPGVEAMLSDLSRG